MSNQLVQLPPEIVTLQIGPPNDACYERILIRELQQPTCLLDAVARLHQHCPADRILLQNRPQRVWQIITTKHLDLGRHPRIIETPHLPEMLMAVDDRIICHWTFYFPFLKLLWPPLNDKYQISKIKWKIKPAWRSELRLTCKQAHAASPRACLRDPVSPRHR